MLFCLQGWETTTRTSSGCTKRNKNDTGGWHDGDCGPQQLEHLHSSKQASCSTCQALSPAILNCPSKVFSQSAFSGVNKWTVVVLQPKLAAGSGLKVSKSDMVGIWQRWVPSGKRHCESWPDMKETKMFSFGLRLQHLLLSTSYMYHCLFH